MPHARTIKVTLKPLTPFSRELSFLPEAALLDMFRFGKHRHPKGNPPSWVRDEATWERAKHAVFPYWGNYEHPYAVVTHVYKNMGGRFRRRAA